MSSPLLWFGNFAKFLKSGFILPGSTSGQVTVQSPSAVTNYTMTLPASQGASGTVPTNDGSGNLSWTTPGTSVASALQPLEQKSANEHYGILTEALDNSVSSGFVQSNGSYPIEAILMDTLTSGTKAIVPVWNPGFLNSSDKNTTTTTNWSLDTNASTLTTSATTKIGATSISFTKTNGGTSSRIKYDAGSAVLAVNGFTDHWFWINLSSATNVNNIQVVIDIDGTNLQTFTMTTNYAGSALATGWNLMHVDLSTGGVASGSGWASTQAFRYYHVGITTANASDVPVVLVNAVFFSIVNPANYVQLGSEITIYDGTNRENAIIDVANSSIVGGGVNLVNNAANTYSGGYGHAILTRTTLSVGFNQAVMTSTDQFGNSETGAITLTQESRLAQILRSALSANSIGTFVDVNTPQVYSAATVTGSTIVVNSTVDQSGDLLSGETVHVFRAIYSDGKLDFIYRGDMTMSSNSSFASNQITLHGTPPAGTVAGDYVVKKVVDIKFSCVAIGANDSFVSATPVASPDGIILYDTGLPIPNQGTVWAHWSQSGSTGYKNTLGVGPDLTVHGTLTTLNQFKNGLFSTSNWSGVNYEGLTAGADVAIDGATVAMWATSFWFYMASGFTGTARLMLGKSDNSSNGWAVYLAGGSNVIELESFNGAATTVSSATIATGQWHHVVAQNDNNVSGKLQLYVDGVFYSSTANTAASGQPFQVGSPPIGGAVSLLSSDILADIWMWSGSNLSATQVQQIYNQGMARILGFGPMIKYRSNDTGISGQNLSIKATLSRDTINVIPSVTAMGIIKTG